MTIKMTANASVCAKIDSLWIVLQKNTPTKIIHTIHKYYAVINTDTTFDYAPIALWNYDLLVWNGRYICDYL